MRKKCLLCDNVTLSLRREALCWVSLNFVLEIRELGVIRTSVKVANYFNCLALTFSALLLKTSTRFMGAAESTHNSRERWRRSTQHINNIEITFSNYTVSLREWRRELCHEKWAVNVVWWEWERESWVKINFSAYNPQPLHTQFIKGNLSCLK